MAEGSHTGTLSSYQVRMGNTGGSYRFKGTMDEARMYNRPLTIEEIKRYYLRCKYAGPTGPSAGTAGDEESGGAGMSVEVTPDSPVVSVQTDYSVSFTPTNGAATDVYIDFSAFGPGESGMDISACSTTAGDYIYTGFAVSPTGLVDVDNTNKVIIFKGGEVATNTAHAITGAGWVITNTPNAQTQPIMVATNSNSGTYELIIYAGPPSIEGLAPTITATGMTVVISGTNFGPPRPASFVTFANGQVAPILEWTETAITCTVPTDAETGNVTVTTPVDISNGKPFTVTPVIDLLSTYTDTSGAPVVISGTGFGPSQGSVTFHKGQPAASILGWTSTAITCTVATDAQTGPITVTALSGTKVEDYFWVSPEITSYSPTTDTGGATVVITGTGFGPTKGSVVFHDGQDVPNQDLEWTSTVITCTVPDDARTGPITVTTFTLDGTDVEYFWVSPVIEALLPDFGVVSDTVVISGTGFGPITDTVTFYNNQPASITNWTSTVITCTVPIDAQTGGEVTVTTDAGLISNGLPFTITAPSITAALDPVSGVVGTTPVVISGNNFGATQGAYSEVKFGGLNGAGDPISITAVCSDWANTEITCTVPADATTGQVTVSTGGGTAESSEDFIIDISLITTLTPISGVTGTEVVITGTNFGAERGAYSQVNFNGLNGAGDPISVTAASYLGWTNIVITCTVPADAVTGQVTVTTGGGTGAGKDFTVLPSITLISPNPAADGYLMVITGTGFHEYQGQDTSYITFADNITDVSISVWTNRVITCLVPSGVETGDVTVATAYGTSTGCNLTVMPIIIALLPDSGVISDTVVISGTGFGPNPDTVTFYNGQTLSISPSDWTSTLITCTVPADAETGDVTVTTIGGVSIGVNFTVTPVINALLPDSGVVGDEVVITGTGFGLTPSVTFYDGQSASILSWTSVSITCVVPIDAQTGEVTVTSGGGTTSIGSSFTISTPSISVFSPVSGAVGTEVVITGTDFGPAQGTYSQVKFDGLDGAGDPISVTATSYAGWTDTVITCTVPADATTGRIMVTTGGGTDESVGDFTINFPSISQPLEPVSGLWYSTVTITGENFGTTHGAYSKVEFDGLNGAGNPISVTAASYLNWTNTEITCTVPADAVTGQVTVATGGGTSEGEDFECTTPMILSLLPDSGVISDTVVISGANFGSIQGSSFVTFYDNQTAPISSSVWTDTVITCTVPVDAQTGGNITVTREGEVSNTEPFTITAPAQPSLSPSPGFVGMTVTISGDYFGATRGAYSQVDFDGFDAGGGAISVTVVAYSDWTNTVITCTVPADARTGEVWVTTGGGTSEGGDFTIAMPSVISLWPNFGLAGMTVTITGTNFGETSGVYSTVNFAGESISVTADCSAWSNTEITCTVPPGARSGEITITTGGGTSSGGVDFTVPGGGGSEVADFAYRKRLTISGTPGASTNCQVRLYVGESSGSIANGADFHLDGHCQEWLADSVNDIRFTDNDGVTELAHWLDVTYEPISGTAPNRVATFWVKVEKDLSNDQDIYIYYGKAGAQSASNGDDTFLIYIDFEAPVTDGSGEGLTVKDGNWAVETMGSGQVYHHTGSGTSENVESIYEGAAYRDFIARYRSREGDRPSFMWAYTGAEHNNFLRASGTTIHLRQYNQGGSVERDSTTVSYYNQGDGNWRYLELKIHCYGTTVYYTLTDLVNGGNLHNHLVKWDDYTDLLHNDNAYLGLGDWYDNSNYVDDLIVRKYVPIEPRVGTVYEEEESSGISDINITPVTPLVNALTDYSVSFTPLTGEATPVVFDFSAFGSGASGMDLSACSTTAGAYLYTGFESEPLSVVVDNEGKMITFTGGTVVTNTAHTISNKSEGEGWMITNTPNVQTQPVMVKTNSDSGSYDELSIYGNLPSIGEPLAPVSGTAGIQVVITGTNFGPPKESSFVTFANGQTAPIVAWTNTVITCTVPENAETGNVTVTTPAGISPDDRLFTVTPVIILLSPSADTSGATVVISGTGFGLTEGSVTFHDGLPPASIVNWTGSNITCLVPIDARTGPITVTTSGGTAVDAFTVTPAIDLFLPGTDTSGAMVVISGTGFSPITGTVTFYNGQILSISPSDWTSTTITCTVPTNAETGDVTVTTDGGPSVGVNFAVTPVITALSSDSGVVNDEIVITGTGFGPSQGFSSVTFYDNQTAPIVPSGWTSTVITCTVPVDAQTGGEVTVNTTGGISNGIPFTITAPSITMDFDPVSGVVGTEVVITGTDFGPAQGAYSKVKFDGLDGAGDPISVTATSYAGWTNTVITCTVPADATTGQIMVTTGGGIFIGETFTITAPSAITFTPTSGVVGTSVTITGTNFGWSQGVFSCVTFGGDVNAVTYTSWTNSEIICEVPSDAQTGPITVTTGGGLAVSVENFGIGQPTIDPTLSPDSGPWGISVTITGTNFGADQGSSYVTFGGDVNAVTYTSWTDNEIVCIVPLLTRSGPITVTTKGGTSSEVVSFNCTNPIIFSVLPQSLVAGDTVTISGDNFGTRLSDSYITFYDGIVVSSTDVVNVPNWSDDVITCTVPADTQTGGEVTVTTSIGGPSNGQPLTITAPSITQDLSPITGVVGDIVTITGTNFGLVRGIFSYVSFTGGVKATDYGWGNAVITCTVPVDTYTGEVTVTTGGGICDPGRNFDIAQPLIDALLPDVGVVGTTVTISGTNFGASQGTTYTVDFTGGVTATCSFWSNNVITCTVPAGAQTGNVTVTTGSDEPSDGVYFNVGHWLDDYDYRKPITIKGSPGAGENYQVKIKVGESGNATGWDLQLDNHCTGFPNDIRFTADDGTTTLAHWSEITSSTAPSRVTIFWVNVLANLDTDQDIFIYYGKSGAESASDGEATFILFDDFFGGSVNEGKWNIVDATGWNVAGGELKATDTSGRLSSQNVFSDGVILETKSRYTTMAFNGYQVIGFYASSHDGFSYLNHPGNDYYRDIAMGGGGGEGWYILGAVVPPDTNLLTRISAKSASAVSLSVTNYDTGAEYQKKSNVTNTVADEHIILGRRDDGQQTGQVYEAYWDWIRARKYASPEPGCAGVAAWGLDNYTYRKKITINGSEGAGENYQVKIKVGESSGAADCDFYLDSPCSNFPNDIRFMNGDSLLD